MHGLYQKIFASIAGISLSLSGSIGLDKKSRFIFKDNYPFLDIFLFDGENLSTLTSGTFTVVREAVAELDSYLVNNKDTSDSDDSGESFVKETAKSVLGMVAGVIGKIDLQVNKNANDYETIDEAIAEWIKGYQITPSVVALPTVDYSDINSIQHLIFALANEINELGRIDVFTCSMNNWPN